jgi:uncharacterized sodium:solute symporter family permease YidK
MLLYCPWQAINITLSRKLFNILCKLYILSLPHNVLGVVYYAFQYLLIVKFYTGMAMLQYDRWTRGHVRNDALVQLDGER